MDDGDVPPIFTEAHINASKPEISNTLKLKVTDYLAGVVTEEGLAQSRLWKVWFTVHHDCGNHIADTAILGNDGLLSRQRHRDFKGDDEKADLRFTTNYLFDAIIQKQLKQFTQGAAQDNLSQSKLLSLKLPSRRSRNNAVLPPSSPPTTT